MRLQIEITEHHRESCSPTTNMNPINRAILAAVIRTIDERARAGLPFADHYPSVDLSGNMVEFEDLQVFPQPAPGRYRRRELARIPLPEDVHAVLRAFYKHPYDRRPGGRDDDHSSYIVTMPLFGFVLDVPDHVITGEAPCQPSG